MKNIASDTFSKKKERGFEKLHRPLECMFQLRPFLLVCFPCILQLIPLSELTAEYQCVAGYVKDDGLLDRSIVSISRIQNLDLWEIYAR